MARAQGKFSQTERCFQILNRLRGFPEGVFLRDLAYEFEVTRRQIERDLCALENGGYHTEIVRRDALGESGATREHSVAVLKEDATRKITLARQERYTILAMRRVFDVLKGTPFHGDMQRVCEKLLQAMPKRDRDELAAMSDKFLYIPDGGIKRPAESDDPASIANAQAMLETLRIAVMNRRLVEYTYREASGREQSGILALYAIVLYRSGLYVVGRRLASLDEAALASDARPSHPFAMERFTKADHVAGKLTAFAAPKDLRLDQLFQGTFGIFIGAGDSQRVVIEFSRAKRAHVLARRWHATQQEENLADGRVRLTLWLTDLKEVKSWVMSWGPHARVLEPVALAAQVEQEHKDAVEWYAIRRAIKATNAADEPQREGGSMNAIETKLTPEQSQQAEQMRKVLATLRPSEEQIIRMQFGIGRVAPMDEQQIAAELAITDAEARRRLTAALERCSEAARQNGRRTAP